jgi:hypothetical protein
MIGCRETQSPAGLTVDRDANLSDNWHDFLSLGSSIFAGYSPPTNF